MGVDAGEEAAVCGDPAPRMRADDTEELEAPVQDSE